MHGSIPGDLAKHLYQQLTVVLALGGVVTGSERWCSWGTCVVSDESLVGQVLVNMHYQRVLSQARVGFSIRLNDNRPTKTAASNAIALPPGTMFR